MRNPFTNSVFFSRLLSVKPEEREAALYSGAFFFFLLCSYYIVRPLRDEMAIAAGVEHIQWLFTATFLLMLFIVPIFGAFSVKLSRRRLLIGVYCFFILNIAAFFLLFKAFPDSPWVARCFFVWVSVFNLFVVSVFWSLMADLFNKEQARRLFAIIASGGSMGAVVGPAITGLLAVQLGHINMLVLSAMMLSFALFCMHRLLRWDKHKRAFGKHSKPNYDKDGTESESNGEGYNPFSGITDSRNVPLGGDLVGGIKLTFRSPFLLAISLLMLLYTSVSTFLYFLQAHIIAEAFDDPSQRTALFAGMDFAVNVLTLTAQIFVTGRVAAKWGMAITLAIIPLLSAVGFVTLAWFPVLSVVVVFQVLRRAGNFAVMRPAREMLYTVVSREMKYKAKNFIDTVVYRGGDALNGWLFSALTAVGLSLSFMALIAVPLALVWMVTGFKLGQYQSRVRYLDLRGAQI